jgi:predicted Zn finger-like uncharacterized protein
MASLVNVYYPYLSTRFPSSEHSAMLVTCPNCQSKIRVPDAAAGKKGKCPKCATVISIPATGEEAAEAAPSEAVTGSSGSPFDFSESAPAPKKGSRVEDEVEEEEAEGEEGAGKKAKKKQESTGLSLTSMILGIVALVCSICSLGSWCVAPVPFLCAVGAIVTGFLGMNKGGKGMAITGICCGGGSILLTIALSIASLFIGGMLSLFNR